MDSEQRRQDAVAAVCMNLGLQLSPDHEREVVAILRSLEAAQDKVDAWLEKTRT